MTDIQCEFLEWEFKCPKSWERLETTDKGNVRFCNACKESVYAVTDNKTAKKLASEGKCVAIFEGDEYEEIVRMGIVKMPVEFELEMVSDPREKKLQIEKKISEINARINQFGETPEQLSRLKLLYSFLIKFIVQIKNSY